MYNSYDKTSTFQKTIYIRKRRSKIRVIIDYIIIKVFDFPKKLFNIISLKKKTFQKNKIMV